MISVCKKKKAVPDTEAQLNIASLSHLQLLNITKESMCKPSHQLKHAVGSPLKTTGCYPISVQHQEKIFTNTFYCV